MSTRASATRQSLLEAATRVFSERGYAGATTKEIAAAAGVAEGTIYRHFEDKQSLFAAVFAERRSTLVVGSLESLIEQVGKGTVRGNIMHLVDALLEMEERMAPLVASVSSDAALKDAMSVSGDDDARLMGPLVPLCAYLAAEQEAGRIRADVDITHAAFAIFAIPFSAATARRLGTPGPSGEGVDIIGALDFVIDAMEPETR